MVRWLGILLRTFRSAVRTGDVQRLKHKREREAYWDDRTAKGLHSTLERPDIQSR